MSFLFPAIRFRAVHRISSHPRSSASCHYKSIPPYAPFGAVRLLTSSTVTVEISPEVVDAEKAVKKAQEMMNNANTEFEFDKWRGAWTNSMHQLIRALDKTGDDNHLVLIILSYFN